MLIPRGKPFKPGKLWEKKWEEKYWYRSALLKVLPETFYHRTDLFFQPVCMLLS